jgi:hypothetical protein
MAKLKTGINNDFAKKTGIDEELFSIPGHFSALNFLEKL